uniref:Uncharacterized protein n=1 Tax=Anguilla anguilla TaxID=7936 RepID=A0A0E9QCV8_ANGAN
MIIYIKIVPRDAL